MFDASKPDGTPRKLLDVSRLTALGWRARIGLEEGIRSTYDSFRQSAAPQQQCQARAVIFSVCSRRSFMAIRQL